MTWLKLDDQFARHEKVAPLSDRAWRLHLTVMLECAAKLTDGRLPRKLLDTLPRAPRGKALARVVSELEAAGLWEIESDYVVVHDFLDWNPSKQDVLGLRSKRSAAGRKGGQQNRSKSQAKQKQEPSKTEAETNPVPVPVPVPKNTPPNPPRGERAESVAQPPPQPPPMARGLDRPEFRAHERLFHTTVEAWDGWTDEQSRRISALGRNPQREAENFRSYWTAEGKRLADWTAKAELRVQQLEQQGGNGGAAPAVDPKRRARFTQALEGKLGEELKALAMKAQNYDNWERLLSDRRTA